MSGPLPRLPLGSLCSPIVFSAFFSYCGACAHPPTSGLLRGICLPCQSRGWGICKFCSARGPSICQPRGQTRAFGTHAVSCQNVTTQRILLEKQAYWLICQGRENLKRFVKACSRFYACLSSLLIKLEFHSEIGSYRRE